MLSNLIWNSISNLAEIYVKIILGDNIISTSFGCILILRNESVKSSKSFLKNHNGVD